MRECPSCSTAVDDASKFCPECGHAMSLEFEQTRPYAPDGDSVDSASDSSFTSSNPSVHGRFVPGSRVADRYRIVSLVGKGGMGEVYRADDLKLGQTVALKFVPDRVAKNPKRLEQFLNEVRLTRQISHPNVCRVHDIGEVDGQTFLSMEYVDGEDLRVLLKRIGRLPPDRGVQIARQICVGVAAAHEQGVLHRDLKPANVMIDGEGRVRVTDFGLAKLADDGAEGEIAGTPAYMAPEQLDRGEASKRSDVYALGLVLYELFTGQPAHSGRSIAELFESHRESTPSLPSELVEGIDPAVESVILRCLAKDPQDRPESAAMVAAALPGGDPLAAALLAGETPSPDLVAASGSTRTLPLWVGITCLVALIVLLGIYPFVTTRVYEERLAWEPESRSLSDLDSQVREDVLEPLGYWGASGDDKPTHSVRGLSGTLLPDGNARLEFWYRQSKNGFLTPEIDHIPNGPVLYAINPLNPRPLAPGMVGVRTNLRGRLVELLVPDGTLYPHGTAEDPVAHLTESSGLSIDLSTPLPEPAQRPAYRDPPVFADDVQVFAPVNGDAEELGATRVVVARDRGRIVYFRAGQLVDVRSDDDVEKKLPLRLGFEKQKSFGPPKLPFWVHCLGLVVLVLAVIFGVQNLMRGRADLQGAFVFAVWIGTTQLLAWVFTFEHLTSLDREVRLLWDYQKLWLAYVLRHWLYYVALEPYVRRFWPGMLIGWTRVTDGRVRDPLVGRELLLGCLAGTALTLVAAGIDVFAPARFLANLDPNSPFHATATALASLHRSPSLAVWFLVQLLMLRLVLRNSWLAVGVFAGIFPLLIALSLPPEIDPLPTMTVVLIYYGGLATLYTRVGLLSGMAYLFTFHMLASFFVTTDWRSDDFGPGTLVALGSVALVGAYGFFTSTLAGRLQATPTTP